ncbi:acetate--CoA ligase family protein, partial [Nonomuraea lactucae]|uniref:acetate--CoA ligase family protein n=1 Tax=Nonomuraea lactucae TaxID=2249762 RepID=UPI0019628100
ACLDAVRAAALIGTAQARAHGIRPVTPAGPAPPAGSPVRTLDEWEAKRALASSGLPVPEGALAGADEAVRCAETLGYPVVVKAVSASLPHKTEAGAVRLNLGGPDAVRAAVEAMSGLSERFLVERMVRDAVAELVVGAHRDPVFGLVITVGAGGVLVELLRDAARILLPASREDVRAALTSLAAWPLLTGYRGRPRGDVEAVIDAVAVVARYARAHADRLVELDVNPLLVLPEGHGVLAADALIRLTEESWDA